MPRRYYRSRRTVVVRPKKKWASNMQIGQLTSATGTSILVENSVQTATPTPVIIKVGNIKLQGDVALQNSSGSTIQSPSLVLIVFYLPEGIALNNAITASIAAQHPEWVMAWKMLDVSTIGSTGTTSSGSAFSVSSRLKRNLNSGDRICVGFMIDNANATVTLKYAAQYWTCAN